MAIQASSIIRSHHIVQPEGMLGGVAGLWPLGFLLPSGLFPGSFPLPFLQQFTAPRSSAFSSGLVQA